MEPPVIIVLLFFTFLPFTLLLTPNFVTTSNGLKIPLIPPNSPESPFYINNITRKQRIEHLLHNSINRARNISLQSKINFTNLSGMSQQELLIKRGSLILIKIGVDTFEYTPIPYKTYYLHLDTGSELTWLQCEDCKIPPNRCFGSPPVVFPNSKSTSYHPIPCDSHELCFKGLCDDDGICSYVLQYVDSTVPRGILAFETFTFNTRSRNEAIDNLMFGCNIHISGLELDAEDIGIMGMGWGPRSFISQIKAQVQNTFSYCFPHYDNTALGSTGYLKIGSDGDSTVEFSSIALRPYVPHSHYYLNLEGISVGETKLAIDPKIFVRNNDQGRTIIDSGTYFTSLVAGAYKNLRRFLKDHISTLGNYRRIESGFGDFKFDLCYKNLVERYVELPSITFHFGLDDLVLTSNNVFIWLDYTRDGFCLAMQPDDTMTTIGAYQQSDFKFIFDRNKKQLYFKPMNCNEGS